LSIGYNVVAIKRKAWITVIQNYTDTDGKDSLTVYLYSS
jgi:hypothetical protein